MAAAVGLAAGGVVADHAAGADEAGVEELLGEPVQAAPVGLESSRIRSSQHELRIAMIRCPEGFVLPDMALEGHHHQEDGLASD